MRIFVENGGHLVLTLRSGMKDQYNALLPQRQPGALAELTGAEVEDYYALLDPVPVVGDGWEGTSHIWAERLRVLDPAHTQVLATYGASNGWLDGRPAITQHGFGRGRVTFIGAYLDEASQATLIQRIAEEAGVQPLLVTPAGVEVCRRIGPDGREVFILINYTSRALLIPLPWSAHEHLRDLDLDTDVLLAPLDVALITRA